MIPKTNISWYDLEINLSLDYVEWLSEIIIKFRFKKNKIFIRKIERIRFSFLLDSFFSWYKRDKSNHFSNFDFDSAEIHANSFSKKVFDKK